MKKIIFTALTLFSFWGCTSLKPDSSHISTADYNKRVEVQNPIYYKQINAVGIGSIVATTAVGAYAGYQSKAMQYNNGSEQKPLDIGNALIGAAVGYTLSYYGNRLLGWGKTTTAPNYKQWLTKANPNYKWLNGGDEDMLRAIHRSAEADFKVQNLSDAQDFAQAFKNSEYTNKLIDQTVRNSSLPRSDFSDMAQIFANATNANKLKKEYIVRSQDVSELLEGAEKYPNIIPKSEFQLRVSDLVAGVPDYKKYKAHFSGLQYDDKIFSKIYKTVSKPDLAFLIKQHPKTTNIHDAKLLMVHTTDNIADLKLLTKEYGIKYQEVIEQKAEQTVLGDRTQFAAFIANFPNYKKLITKGNTHYLGGTNSQREPEGIGMLWNKTEGSYRIGDFRNGKLSGSNCQIDEPGYAYRGGMVDGKKSGQGLESSTSDGYNYEGGFRGDEFSGRGTFRGKLGRILQLSGTGIYTGGFLNGGGQRTRKIAN
jgi:hypothetical protein